MSKILVAHSPDADDIFMYYAIYFGWVGSKNIKFENIALDIETLNRSVLESKYLISAISFGVYPFIKDNYALLNTAMSFGYGYGPKLIKRKGTHLKRNFKVALSGQYTTNALLFRIRYPDARIVYKNFLEIEQSVLNREVDAGVLIHESILNFDESLEVEAHLWDIWCDLSGSVYVKCESSTQNLLDSYSNSKDSKQDSHNLNQYLHTALPLPLGGMAILRSIPLLRAIECQEILSKAVSVAVNNKKILSKMLASRVRVDENELETYLNMYANKHSISLDESQILALNKLFQIGYDAKIYKDLIDVDNFLLPSDYKALRFS